MGLFPNEHETIVGVAREIQTGARTCMQVLEKCLDRIEEWEPRLKAWVVVDRMGALEQAEQLDLELAEGVWRGPLHGIPIGVKDLYDVAGLPTAVGFAPWSKSIASTDAQLVGALRSQGAIILGKTVTTQFAWVDPPATRNPWSLEHTPGGSSSGSSAAVACGMCLGALGSQTGGSIIRPASFCGVAGLKPSYGGPSAGLFPFSPRLDHPGLIARSVGDLQLLHEGAFGGRSLDQGSREESRSEPPSRSARPPRIAWLQGAFQERAERAAQGGMERAVRTLRATGAEVNPIPDLFDLDEMIEVHRTIMAHEASMLHAGMVGRYPGEYQPRIRALIEEGRNISDTAYWKALQYQDAWRSQAHEACEDIDVLLMPAALGPAPDCSTTGDPIFNSPWSLSGWPAVSFPIELTAEGLPIAVQLVAPRLGDELLLLRAGLWCERVIQDASRMEQGGTNAT